MVNRRRERFVDYFKNGPLRGSRELLMRKTGLTKGRISQLFDEAQPFGERAAASLAERLGLPPTYFESDLYGPPGGGQEVREQEHHYFTGLFLTPEQQRLINSALKPEQFQKLIQDLTDLLPEERDDLLVKTHERAEKMRRYKDSFLKMRGLPPAVPDHKVAEHIKPAPPWDGHERREEPQPVEEDRRRVYFDYGASPPSPAPRPPKKRGAS